MTCLNSHFIQSASPRCFTGQHDGIKHEKGQTRVVPREKNKIKGNKQLQREEMVLTRAPIGGLTDNESRKGGSDAVTETNRQ